MAVGEPAQRAPTTIASYIGDSSSPAVLGGTRIDKEHAALGATLPQSFETGRLQGRPEGLQPIHVGELDGGEHRRLQISLDGLDLVAHEDIAPAMLGDEGSNLFDVLVHGLRIEKLVDDPHDVGRHIEPPFRVGDYLAPARNLRTMPPGRRVSKSRTSTQVGRIAMRTVCGESWAACSTHACPASRPM